jgi:hypothetical protein
MKDPLGTETVNLWASSNASEKKLEQVEIMIYLMTGKISKTLGRQVYKCLQMLYHLIYPWHQSLMLL